MEPIQWIVTIAGLALVAGVLWYFFAPNRDVAVGRPSASPAGQPQTVDVQVEGGYSPATIEMTAGRPMRLNFMRQEDNDCSAELLIPDLHIRRELPAFQTTTVDLPAVAAGTYPFTCGMGMLKGRLIVK